MSGHAEQSGTTDPRRTIVLSDLHLGRTRFSAGSAADVRPLWRGFDRVVFNGDLAEIHHPRRRVAAANEVMRVLDGCARDGVEAILLSGNHDPFLSERRRLNMAAGQVFITHGDVFHPAIAPWSPAAPKMEEEHERALRTCCAESASSLEARLAASRHASHVEWVELERQARRSSVRGMAIRPWAVAQVLWYWRRFPDIVARFADEHRIAARYILCGHTHHAGIWQRNRRTVINTGSFGFPGRPRAVTLVGDTLSVWRVIRGGSGYALADEPLRIFALDPTAPSFLATDESAPNTREVSPRPSAAAI